MKQLTSTTHYDFTLLLVDVLINASSMKRKLLLKNDNQCLVSARVLVPSVSNFIHYFIYTYS